MGSIVSDSLKLAQDIAKSLVPLYLVSPLFFVIECSYVFADQPYIFKVGLTYYIDQTFIWLAY